MARTAKQPKPAEGIAISLSAARRFMRRAQELATGDQHGAPEFKFGWAPNDCCICDGKRYVWHEHKILGRKKRWCKACNGTGKGPQAEALRRLEKEILYGGQKGGGKTACMTVWMISGNPHEPDMDRDGVPILRNQSYAHDPRYRGLVIRKNREDLKAWIAEAKMLYANLGGIFANNEFRFPSGALIWTGHMDDPDSWQKYQGYPELHRVGWEEICQIPDEEAYAHMVSCVRSTTPGLRAQLFLTGNPIGPGFGWVRDRFVRVKDENGEPVAPGTPIVKRYKHPFTGAQITTTRIFIRAGLRDNPYLMRDPEYVASLMDLPKQLREAYLDGNWEAAAGTFFSEFRPEGPLSGEPENANHVVGPRNTEALRSKSDEPITEWRGYPALKPWWPRAIGGDWGFSHNASFHWGALNPESGELHVYRERVYNKTSIQQVGVEVAKASMEDLIATPSRSLVMFFSRDAFETRNRYNDSTASFVEMLIQGMCEVLGQDMAYAPQFKPTDRSELMSTGSLSTFEHNWKQFVADVRVREQSGIVVVKAMTSRVVGAQKIRELMKWTPPIDPNLSEHGEFDWEVYRKVAFEYGLQEAFAYLNLHQSPKRNMAYPKLKIWEEACPHLIDALGKAQHDPKNPEDVDKNHWKGSDSYDSFRYLVTGMDAIPADRPWSEHRAQVVDEYKQANPQADARDMIWLQRHLDNEEYEQNQMAHGRVHRAATRGRRLARREADRMLHNEIEGWVH